MRSLLLFTLPILALALSFPDLPVLPRQAPGTPQYDCHAACGSVIQLARTPSYCQPTNFTTNLSSCLNCALEFEIWQYYGDSVSEAAENCGLDGTPVPVNGTSTSIAPGTASASATVTGASSAAATDAASGAASETATGDSDAATSTPTATTEGSGTGAAASATAASETADSASRPTINDIFVVVGMLAWLIV